MYFNFKIRQQMHVITILNMQHDWSCLGRYWNNIGKLIKMNLARCKMIRIHFFSTQVIVGSALLGWLSAAPGYIALSLIGPVITICILIYLFVQVQSLFKQFGEKNNAVTPMNGNGNAFYSKHI